MPEAYNQRRSDGIGSVKSALLIQFAILETVFHSWNVKTYLRNATGKNRLNGLTNFSIKN